MPTPITISNFFVALLPKVSGSVETYMAMAGNKDLGQLWRGSVYFNHFVRIKACSITVVSLRRAYARCAAIIAPGSFEGCNLVVPILLKDCEREMMDCLLI